MKTFKSINLIIGIGLFVAAMAGIVALHYYKVIDTAYAGIGIGIVLALFAYALFGNLKEDKKVNGRGNG